MTDTEKVFFHNSKCKTFYVGKNQSLKIDTSFFINIPVDLVASKVKISTFLKRLFTMFTLIQPWISWGRRLEQIASFGTRPSLTAQSLCKQYALNRSFLAFPHLEKRIQNHFVWQILNSYFWKILKVGNFLKIVQIYL